MANRSFWLFRISAVSLGGAAIWWGIVGIQLFWRQSVTERLADQIIVGAPFKKEILLNQIPVVMAIETAPYCRPIALRSAALLRLRIAEMSTSDAQNGSEEQLASSRSAISKSLICSPSDSFLWLSLFWVDAHSV